MNQQVVSLSKNREQNKRQSQMDWNNQQLAIITENQELRRLNDYYKGQYAGRQDELNQLLDENHSLRKKLQK